jgi:low temperature requirement protein LtrA
VLGESVVAVAIATAGAHWHFTSATAAVLGFASVCAIWWLYFDRQGGVALRGSTVSIVVYSYAHLPLLIGLAAMSAGLRLLIERAGSDRLGAGSSVAFLGGAALFVVSLIAMRLVTVQRSHRRGATLKLAAAAFMLGLLAAESALPPLALAACLAVLLAVVIYVDRRLLGPT